MPHVNIRLHKGEFEAVQNGETEVVRYAAPRRIRYLCFARITKECNEPQNKCSECFENARAGDGYMCYPFEKAVLRKGQTSKYITKNVAEIYWEERNGKIWFVFKLKPDDSNNKNQ